MDIVFNCPNCEQELAVDQAGAGTQIECPACGETITIPAGSGKVTTSSLPAAPPSPAPSAISTSAAAKVEMHLKVPTSHAHTESLIEKPKAPLEVAAKESDKKIKVKTIKHTDCIEVGHDKFDEVVTNFLNKVGEPNVVSVTALTYTHIDIGSQKLLTDFGVMVIYRG